MEKIDVGDTVVCVDIYKQRFKNYPLKPIKHLTKGRKYEVVKIDEYKHCIYIKNDDGIIKFYKRDRFKNINEFRCFKLKKIMNRIYGKNNV